MNVGFFADFASAFLSNNSFSRRTSSFQFLDSLGLLPNRLQQAIQFLFINLDNHVVPLAISANRRQTNLENKITQFQWTATLFRLAVTAFMRFSIAPINRGTTNSAAPKTRESIEQTDVGVVLFQTCKQRIDLSVSPFAVP